MGVKLTDLIERKPLSWESLEGKKLAVDASNVLFQFLSSIRQADGTPLMDREGNTTSHLMGLFTRIPNLLQKGITPIFVFDGKAPDLKEKVRKKRREAKSRAWEKYEQAKEKEDEQEMGKYAKQLSYLNKQMVEQSKELLNALGLPTVQAPSEAEAQCAHMAKKRLVWATASQDYDSLLFGSPRLLQNLTLAQKRKMAHGKFIYISPYLLELKEILEKLELNQEELIMLGILIGTDYNPEGIKGIGPKKALKHIQSGKKFDQICKELHANFDWKEIMDTFKHIPVEDTAPKNPPFNPDKVKELLVEQHDFSMERVEKTITMIQKKKDTSLRQFF